MKPKEYIFVGDVRIFDGLCPDKPGSGSENITDNNDDEIVKDSMSFEDCTFTDHSTILKFIRKEVKNTRNKKEEEATNGQEETRDRAGLKGILSEAAEEIFPSSLAPPPEKLPLQRKRRKRKRKK